MKHTPLYICRFFIIAICLIVFSSCRQSKPETESNVSFKQTDNILRARILSDPPVLNSLIATTSATRQVTNQIFQYLIIRNPSAPSEYIPQLAKAYPTVLLLEDGPFAGGMKISFELHESAVWDDGTPITGADYLFTLKAALIPGVGSRAIRSALNAIKDVKINSSNPKQFDVFFDKVNFLAVGIAGGELHIYPKHIYDPNQLLDNIPLESFTDEANIDAFVNGSAPIQEFITAFTSAENTRENLVGSNAYKFVEWINGQRIVLERKENWWGDELSAQFPALNAFPESIIYQTISDENAAISALKSEEIDVAWQISPNNFNDLKASSLVTDKYNLNTLDRLAFFFVYINTERDYLSDKNVRKALAHSINLDTIIQQFFKGYASKLATTVAEGINAHNSALQPVAYNPTLAKQLLAEAGWEDSNNNGTVDKMLNGELQELTLEYGVNAETSSSQALGLLIKTFAAEVGIGIDLVTKESNLWLDALIKGNYDLYSGGNTQQLSWFPRQKWHSQADDRTGFATAQTDALIEQIEQTIDETERNKLCKQLQEIIYEEMPIIYLFIPQNNLAIHKRFESVPTRDTPGFFHNLMKKKEL